MPSPVGEAEEIVREFAEESPFPYPVLYDAEGVLYEAEILGLPTVVVLDREGEVVLKRTGITGASELRKTVDEALVG